MYKAGKFLVIAVLFAVLSAASVSAAETIAVPSAHTVFVDNEPVPFRAFNIADSNFFMLRDIAFALSGTPAQFDVTWDGTRGAINLVTGRPYTVVGGEMAPGGGGSVTAVPSTAAVYIDGRRANLRAYNIDNNNFFMLRDLGTALDFGVEWNSVLGAVMIDSGAEEYVPAVLELVLPSDIMVYTFLRDVHFHAARDCPNRRDHRLVPRPISLEEARLRAYRPCAYCYDLEAEFPTAAAEASPVSRAPTFPFGFTTEDLHGNTVTTASLGDYEAFFVYYWTTWCSACVRSMPNLVSLAEEFAGRVGFLTLLGDFDTARETAIRITNDVNAPFYTINATHGELRPLLALLDSGFVPTSVVIGTDGSVIGEQIVGGNVATFRAAIENAIGR